MQNAAYCRLKNVTLGYTLPADLTKKFYVNNLRFFVSAENLFTITNLCDTFFDPETMDCRQFGKDVPPIVKDYFIRIKCNLLIK